jgi:hypothetical protein
MRPNQLDDNSSKNCHCCMHNSIADFISKDTYAGMNVTVEALSIDQSDLSTKRMLDLMAVNQDEGQMPLYLHSINRILRELRIKQQKDGGSFDYAEFKHLAIDSNMTPHQLAPLNQRLDTLESFIPRSQIGVGSKSSIRGRKYDKKGKQGRLQERKGSNWDIKVGLKMPSFMMLLSVNRFSPEV